MRLRFGLKSLLSIIGLVAIGLGVWRATVGHYRACHEREEAVLAQFAEAIGEYRLETFHPGVFVIGSLPNQIHRTEQVPPWIESLDLSMPREWFKRTTQLALHSIDCLANPSIGDKPGPIGPPAFLQPDHARELDNESSIGAPVDWRRQTERLEKVRRLYRAVSELTELEVLKPGPLMGNEELSWFKHHPKLRVLDLSYIPFRHYASRNYFSAVDEQGLEIIAEGFPALRYLILHDGWREWDGMHSTGRIYSEEAVARLRAKRPELTIVHYQTTAFRAYGTMRRIEPFHSASADTVRTLNALECGLQILPAKAPTAAWFAAKETPSPALLTKLADEPSPQAVDCGRAAWDDDQYRYLQAAKGLEFVSVAEAPITGRGVEHLAACPMLTGLALSEAQTRNPQIVEGLKKFRRLEHLIVVGLSDEEPWAETLRRRLPGTSIECRRRRPDEAKPDGAYVLVRQIPSWAEAWAIEDGFSCFDVLRKKK
jgi:hypothetical protein